MASKKESIYVSGPKLDGNITITLNGSERSMIVAALCKAAPHEADIFPLATLAEKIMKGK